MTYTDTRRRYLARRAEYLAEKADREAKRELRRTRYRRTMGDRRRESARDADCGMLAPVVLRRAARPLLKSDDEKGWLDSYPDPELE